MGRRAEATEGQGQERGEYITRGERLEHAAATHRAGGCTGGATRGGHTRSDGDGHGACAERPRRYHPGALDEPLAVVQSAQVTPSPFTLVRAVRVIKEVTHKRATPGCGGAAAAKPKSKSKSKPAASKSKPAPVAKAEDRNEKRNQTDTDDEELFEQMLGDWGSGKQSKGRSEYKAGDAHAEVEGIGSMSAAGAHRLFRSSFAEPPEAPTNAARRAAAKRRGIWLATPPECGGAGSVATLNALGFRSARPPSVLC